MSTWNPDKIEQAWAYATRQHQGQTYGGRAEGEQVAYMTHIGAVVMELMWAVQSDASADADLALQCAVLHDTIEDTGATFDAIREKFVEAYGEFQRR